MIYSSGNPNATKEKKKLCEVEKEVLRALKRMKKGRKRNMKMDDGILYINLLFDYRNVHRLLPYGYECECVCVFFCAT